jgi:hypothetical protein
MPLTFSPEMLVKLISKSKLVNRCITSTDSLCKNYRVGYLEFISARDKNVFDANSNSLLSASKILSRDLKKTRFNRGVIIISLCSKFSRQYTTAASFILTE